MVICTAAMWDDRNNKNHFHKNRVYSQIKRMVKSGTLESFNVTTFPEIAVDKTEKKNNSLELGCPLFNVNHVNNTVDLIF